ncbi:MAG TPA: Ig domain-containing protein, partial [Candidatus Manganitrophaceae bacterium]
DMLNPAFTDSYTPNATVDNYLGYFKPTGCYQYSSNKFEEVLNTSGIPNRSYTGAEACPSSAPFRGNLMNWATMSRYDILQKVIIGGNSASKQGNAHTLVGMSGVWADKSYNGCIFRVNSANLTITESGAGACALIDNPASPIAFLNRLKTGNIFAWLSGKWGGIYTALSVGAMDLFSSAIQGWEEFSLTATAWASHTLNIGIKTGTLNGTVQLAYSLTLECSGSGSACPNGTYGWNITGLPGWASVANSSQGSKVNIYATISGTPTAAGSYPFSATLSLSGHTSKTTNYTIVVAAAPLQINTTSLLDGNEGSTYGPFTMQGQGGVTPYTWSATGLPAGLSIDTSSGVISGIPTTNGNYNNVVVTLSDSDAPAATVTKTFSIRIDQGGAFNSQSYNVKVDLAEEPLTDLNGNDIWDSGESYTDSNGNGVWDGKQGIFQKFWDENNPRARWGLTKFSKTGEANIDACIPASPASSFFTTIQNATPSDLSPLADGLYGAINYYGFNAPYTDYNGCNNADPIDNVPC